MTLRDTWIQVEEVSSLGGMTESVLVCRGEPCEPTPACPHCPQAACSPGQPLARWHRDACSVSKCLEQPRHCSGVHTVWDRACSSVSVPVHSNWPWFTSTSANGLLCGCKTYAGQIQEQFLISPGIVSSEAVWFTGEITTGVPLTKTRAVALWKKIGSTPSSLQPLSIFFLCYSKLQICLHPPRVERRQLSCNYKEDFWDQKVSTVSCNCV